MLKGKMLNAAVNLRRGPGFSCAGFLQYSNSDNPLGYSYVQLWSTIYRKSISGACTVATRRIRSRRETRKDTVAIQKLYDYFEGFISDCEVFRKRAISAEPETAESDTSK
jgi:hypothetical protein